MSTNDPNFALLPIKEPKGDGFENLRTEWQKLRNLCGKHAEKNKAIEVLGPSALLLPVPDTFPILCEIVADAQQSGLQYTVRLFGQPALSYGESK